MNWGALEARLRDALRSGVGVWAFLTILLLSVGLSAVGWVWVIDVRGRTVSQDGMNILHVSRAVLCAVVISRRTGSCLVAGRRCSCISHYGGKVLLRDSEDASSATGARRQYFNPVESFKFNNKYKGEHVERQFAHC